MKTLTLTKANLFKITFLFSLALMTVISGCGSAEKKSNGPDTALKAENEQPNDQKANEQSGFKVTFVELGSVRCIPCKMMQPIMADIEKEYGDQVKVVFYDVWTEEGRPYAGTYGISAIPTQVFLDADGKEYYRHIGFFPKEELIKILQQKGVN